MRLAFDNQAHYADFSEGYKTYLKRTKVDKPVDEKTYKRIVKAYCKRLAQRFEEDGMIDLPCEMGTVTTAILTRRPQYRGKKFIGFGKKDWTTGLYDGTLKTFGIVFLPNRKVSQNLRCFGFVTNRRLFKKMKELNDGTGKKWTPVVFNDEMV